MVEVSLKVFFVNETFVFKFVVDTFVHSFFDRVIKVSVLDGALNFLVEIDAFKRVESRFMIKRISKSFQPLLSKGFKPLFQHR